MQHLADLLATIPLPPLEEPDRTSPVRLPSGPWGLGCEADLIHDLGADLPAGHLHVWGGPAGAGKTSFLLSLLHGAASRGRRVTYATYDLAPESLALRMLAMASQIELSALPDPGGAPEACTLSPAELRRAHAACAALSRLPFFFLAARGLSVESLNDRLVRMPFRAEVLAVDYLQGVIRKPGTDTGLALRDLSDLAAHLHVAVICAVRPHAGDLVADDDLVAGDDLRVGIAGALASEAGRSALGMLDRVGWIAPTEPVGPADEGAQAFSTGRQASLRRAEVVHNRHGGRPVLPLAFDEATGVLGRASLDAPPRMDARPSAP